ncbi:MAG: rod shape-determining protein MreC [Limnohabitans sp.]|jgi:rod shape-determining protein MreC
MALDTLDRSPPPIFRQGLSSLSKLVLLGLLAVLLMSVDKRLNISQPIRSTVSVLLTPLAWLSLQPGRAVTAMGAYFSRVDEARDVALQYQTRTIGQAQRLQQVEQLMQENTHLRQLMELRSQVTGPSKAVEVLYETADPYTQHIVIDKGQLSGIVSGSAVMDVAGVVGQVTRVYPLVSEVTVLTDRDQSIPVMNARTGQRYVAFGDPMMLGGSLELRFVPASADVQEGDLLTTSGIDGVYPAGLHVGRVQRIDRRIDTAFAKVYASPMARARGRHLLILPPAKDAPAKPQVEESQPRKKAPKAQASTPQASASGTGGRP